MTLQINTDNSFNYYIQEIRAIHSIMEYKKSILIEQDERIINIFNFLSKYFRNVRITTNLNKESENYKVYVNHLIPNVIFENKTYPLLFPIEFIDRFINLNTNKDLDFVFIGQITKNRILSLLKFALLQKKYSLMAKTFLTIIKMVLKQTREGSVVCKNDLFIFTNRGRNEINKYFDEDYFSILLRAKYVICPSGDYDWTYRFFEAIICFAIPYAQSLELYQNYSFNILFKENLDFSRDEKLNNLETLVRTLTIESQLQKSLLQRIDELRSEQFTSLKDVV